MKKEGDFVTKEEAVTSFTERAIDHFLIHGQLTDEELAALKALPPRNLLEKLYEEVQPAVEKFVETRGQDEALWKTGHALMALTMAMELGWVDRKTMKIVPETGGAL